MPLVGGLLTPRLRENGVISGRTEVAESLWFNGALGYFTPNDQ